MQIEIKYKNKKLFTYQFIFIDKYQFLFGTTQITPKTNPLGISYKWAYKYNKSYMLNFKSYLKNLTRKYLVTERHLLRLQGILLQYLKFN